VLLSSCITNEAPGSEQSSSRKTVRAAATVPCAHAMPLTHAFHAQVVLQRCTEAIRYHFGVTCRPGEFPGTGNEAHVDEMDTTSARQRKLASGIGQQGSPMCVGLLTDQQVHDVILRVKCSVLHLDAANVRTSLVGGCACRVAPLT